MAPIGLVAGRPAGVRTIGGAIRSTWRTTKHGSTQRAVALSSAEAELHALHRFVAEAVGVHMLAIDFGLDWRAVLRTDASAAIGMAWRRGAGKLNHIAVH